MSLALIAALALAPQTKAKAPVKVAAKAASAQPVEVPFRIGEDAIIVDAVVNGRKVSLMFDTGFGGHVVVGDHIALGKSTGKMTLRDFVGEMEADTVKINTLKLGDRAMKLEKDATAVVMGGNDYSLNYNTHCDGIMGFSVIKDNITEINFEKKKFIIYPAGYDITKRKADGKTTFLNKLLPIGQSSMEMLVGTPSGKSMTLALDTGNAFYGTTHKDVLERVGLWTGGKDPKFMKTAYVASGPVDSWYMKMPQLSIYGVPVPTSVWSIIDLPSSSAEGDGTVGFGFLKNFNILIDYDKRRVWMENWTGKTTDAPEAETGITAFFDPGSKRNIVYRVAPDSPAAKAGIKERDILVAVDGKEVGNIGYRRMVKLMTGAPGSKVEISTSRGGSLKKTILERMMLVNE